MKKNSIIAISIAIIAIIAIFIIAGKKSPTPVVASVTGTVTYRERIALPPDTLVTVQLIAAPDTSSEPTVINEQIITPEPEQQVPFAFALDYDSATINPETTYTISAKITSGENVLWMTDTAPAVITDVETTTTDIEIVLVRSSSLLSESPMVPTIAFQGTEFRLVDHNGTKIPDNENYTVSFADGTVSAKFCNGVGGEYTMENFVITAPALISTMMFCEEPSYLMNIETSFGQALNAGVNMTISMRTLVLQNTDHRFVFHAR
jgi:putative lipoprotein